MVMIDKELYGRIDSELECRKLFYTEFNHDIESVNYGGKYKIQGRVKNNEATPNKRAFIRLSRFKGFKGSALDICKNL